MKNETFTPERIKAEADAFFEWDGEDRSLVTTTSCLLFAQHIAGLMQARSAQPAPVVPAECADLNHHERYRAGWNACRAAMLTAPPAQVKQVECQECQECERLQRENEALASGLRGKHATTGATYSHLIAERDQLRAELSALKAQQVGQEPVAWRVWNGKTWRFCYSDLHGKRGWEALYTTPQPAPAQDVADDLRELLTEMVDIHRRRGVVLTIHIEQIADILAAHDKQSGGEV